MLVTFPVIFFQLSGIFQRTCSISKLFKYFVKKIDLINRIEKKLKAIKIKKNQIFIIDLKIYQFKYNSSRREVLKEEQEEVVGLPQDRGGDKVDRMYHPCMILASCIIVEFRWTHH
jgi:hypothetical protein